MSRILVAAFAIILMTASYASGVDSRSKIALAAQFDLKGWNHLFTALVLEGVSPQLAASVIADKRMPKAEPLIFKVKPRESNQLYRKRNTLKERKNALTFYKKHKALFEQAEKTYQVPSSVVLALLQIESRCGADTGRSRVFHRLARLAFASSSESINKSFEKNRQIDKTVTIEEIRSRGQWLQDHFLPHAKAALLLAEKLNIHPLELRGSSAGAIGMPQFLPGNYFEFGVDGDQNGNIELLSAPDAIFSVSNFLRAHGWDSMKMPKSQQQAVLWHYNRSEPYVKTVLSMARSLRRSMQ